MRRVACNHQHEGLDLFDPIAAGVGLQLHLGGLVHAHAVLQLDALHLFRRHVLGVKVALRHHGGLFHKAVFHGAGQRVVHHHVLERHRPLGCVSTNGVAVSSRPISGFSSLMARTPALAR